MTHPTLTRTIARTAVVGSWVLALALVGRPGWLAALLSLALVAVWASPLLSATNRRAVLPVAGPEPAVEPREAGTG